MTTTVTGATGHLGRLVVDALLRRGVPAGEIVAAVRTPEKAADLAGLGVQVREADYDRPETLRAAFAGSDQLLLISSSDLANREAQHRAAVAAAVEVGVGLVAYTSVLHADTTQMLLAKDHRTTEALLAESGLPTVLLRNGWYLENYEGDVAGGVEHGAITAAAGEGRIAAATRAEYAEAAAVVLTTDGQAGKVYELSGSEDFTLTDLAALVAETSGKPVVYRDLPVDEYQGVLEGFGLPAPAAAVFADTTAAAARGELAAGSTDLQDLIGRPTTPVATWVRGALAA